MDDKEKFEQLCLAVASIEALLRGYNGHGGLLQNLDNHCQADERFRQDYYKFKRACFAVGGMLVGSGVLGVSIWRILI